MGIGCTNVEARAARMCTNVHTTGGLFREDSYTCVLSEAEVLLAPRTGAKYRRGQGVVKKLDIPRYLARSLMEENIAGGNIRTFPLVRNIRRGYFFTTVRRYEYEVDWEEHIIGNRVRTALHILDILDGDVEIRVLREVL